LQTGQVAHCCVSRVRWRPAILGERRLVRMRLSGRRRPCGPPLSSRTRRETFKAHFTPDLRKRQ
jgi:hypothetical protein